MFKDKFNNLTIRPLKLTNEENIKSKRKRVSEIIKLSLKKTTKMI